MALRDSIRILSLHPSHGDNSNPIRCDLHVVALKDKPNYEALSYVWGKASAVINIEVSGRTVGITPSLHAALRRLRLSDATRPLWIDQLCINQWDNDDKAHQVGLMRYIYAQCRECLIWLGEVPDDLPRIDLETGLRILRSMADFVREKQDSLRPVAHPPLIIDAEFDSLIKTLQPIKEHPWWRRLWTVQEAVLPPKLTIIWGQSTIPWATLEVIRESWDDANRARLLERLGTDAHAEHVFNRLYADIAWLGSAKSGHDTPPTLIKRWRFRHATDARDKIYGLMGLSSTSSNGISPHMEVSYQRSTDDVYCDLTYDLILGEESLLPLIIDPRLEKGKATPNIPRWALDLAQLSDWHTDWMHFNSWPEYRAHGGRILDVGRLAANWTKTNRTMKVEGVFVDVVEHVGEQWLNADGLLNDYDALGERLRSWKDLAQRVVQLGAPYSHEPYPGGYSFSEAFGRLILGSFVRDQNQGVERGVCASDVQLVDDFLESRKRNNLYRTIKGMTINRRFFVTKSGLMGLGHMDTEVGDEAWVFEGGNFPFTLHQKKGGGPNDYEFQGFCYVQGIMDGEATRGCNWKIVTLF